MGGGSLGKDVGGWLDYGLMRGVCIDPAGNQ